MASEDLSFNVSGDTKGLDQALGKSVNTFTKDFRSQFENILNDVGGDKFFKGIASKKWDTIPHYQAHLPGGKAWVTSAYMSGMAKDLQQMGYGVESPVYQNALFAAGMRQVNQDPMERYNMLRAYGLDTAAVYAHPGSDLGQIMDVNARLMEQGWAREFITDKSVKVPVMATSKDTGKQYQKRKRNPVTGKLEPVFNEVTETSADFEGMRKRAVELGIAHWVDPDKKVKVEGSKKKVLDTSAANFAFNDELETLEEIDDVSEDIGKKTEGTKKHFVGWHDTLKGILGTMTAIAGIPIGITKAAEAGVKTSADYTPNTTPFYGMGTEDYIKARNASLALNLGPDAIYSDIGKLASMRAEFKSFGQGLDPVFSSLAGVFNKITETTNPVTAYKQIAQALTDTVKQISGITDKSEREDALAQYKMLIDKIGIASFGEIAGALNKPEGISTKFPDVESLFTIEDNPFYSALEQAKVINAEISKLNNSIGASYSELYNSWEETFGLRFEGWWDDFLKGTFVPWATKILDLFNPSDAEEGWDFDTGMRFANDVKSFNEASLKAIESQSAYLSLATRGLPETYRKGTLTSIYGSGIRDDSYMNVSKAVEFRNLLSTINKYADYKDEYGRETVKGKRAAELKSFLEITSLDKELGNRTVTDTDKYLGKFAQAYLSTVDDEAAKTLMESFSSYIGDKIIMEMPEFKELVNFLKEGKTAIGQSATQEFIITIKDAWGQNIGAYVENVTGAQSTLNKTH